MITGAPSLTYSVQYASTIEFVSQTAAISSDVVPIRVADYGSAKKSIKHIYGHNPAHPESWSFNAVIE